MIAARSMRNSCREIASTPLTGSEARIGGRPFEMDPDSEFVG